MHCRVLESEQLGPPKGWHRRAVSRTARAESDATEKTPLTRCEARRNSRIRVLPVAQAALPGAGGAHEDGHRGSTPAAFDSPTLHIMPAPIQY